MLLNTGQATSYNDILTAMARIICILFSISSFTVLGAAALSLNHPNRRVFLSRQGAILSGIGTGLLVNSVPKPAFADVSDGNALPDGAAQYSRILRLKSDLVGVNKRLADNAEKIDKNEWDNLSDFMRLVYRCGEDMKAITKSSIYDSEKKKKANEVISTLQKFAQASDSAVSKEDTAALLSITKKVAILVDDFFELLRDIPDEL